MLELMGVTPETFKDGMLEFCEAEGLAYFASTVPLDLKEILASEFIKAKELKA